MPDKLYYPIGEVAQMLNVNPSLLRYWETEFPSIRPHKNKKGTRYYTDDDIALLRQIYHLTRECGYTLEGARERLRLSRLPKPSTTPNNSSSHSKTTSNPLPQPNKLPHPYRFHTNPQLKPLAGHKCDTRKIRSQDQN